MKWKLISQDRCPKDGSRMERTSTGFECRHFDSYYTTPCGFFITHEKAKVLKGKLRRKPVQITTTPAV